MGPASHPPSPFYRAQPGFKPSPNAGRKFVRVCITQAEAPGPKTYKALGLPAAAIQSSFRTPFHRKTHVLADSLVASAATPLPPSFNLAQHAGATKSLDVRAWF